MCSKTITLSSSMSQDSFWTSVDILIKKPHVTNKRLWGCKTLINSQCKCLKTSEDLELLKPKRLNNTYDIEEYKASLFEHMHVEEQSDTNTESNVRVILLELLPKCFSEIHAFQLIIILKTYGLVIFHDITPEKQTHNLCPDFSYSLIKTESEIKLKAETDDTNNTYKWLRHTVLTQLLKWGENSINKTENFCNDSLSLVSSDKYYNTYNELKAKYGKQMVKIWPECTDPAKFVYEDIAIGTYLLLLWGDEKKFFVDLGCGNGLLVYILTKEGHHGLGIDVRKRNIWDMYPKDVCLEERTITPSNVHLFPETDWIIGNHSDELTPWIPVITARSSYKCNFFLLPCCAFNFDGSKYQRRNSSLSQYNEYLHYIKQLCEDCGFNTNVDRLKIPSTKRICLIGRSRIYPETDFHKHCEKIHKLIYSGLNKEKEDNEDRWTANFKARDPKERVRNCTQIDKTLIENIVNNISSHLIKTCTLDSSWNLGDEVDISNVVNLVPPDELKLLKSECGGLQTLLRNNHHIFNVQNGKVKLRHPKTVEEVLKSSNTKSSKVKLKVRQKPCWFYNNHPQGCPLTDDSCSFLHVKS